MAAADPLPPSPSGQPLRRTSITCTIGPKSEQKPALASVLDAGMDVMRLNFSHGQVRKRGDSGGGGDAVLLPATSMRGLLHLASSAL